MFIEELIDFFHKYFINSENDPKKDFTIRLYVSFFLLYIEGNKFNDILFNSWSYEIKPYLIKKYPLNKENLFQQNSDLEFLIKSLENEIKKYKKEVKEKSKITLLSKEFDTNQKNNLGIKRINSMINLTNNFKEINYENTLNDTNILDDGNLNINQLIENNNGRKGNDRKDGGFLEVLRKNYTNNIEKEKDLLNIKVRNKRSKTTKNIKEMLPRYKDVKEENDINIFYKEPNNNLTSISADLMLKKIIFEDFMNKNELLIYHFCQQCFCFINKDIFFKKIFDCYKFYKNNISIVKLKNLIDFINILIIEMFDYYKTFDFKESHFELIKKFYNELINDLIKDVIKDERNEGKNDKKLNNAINEIYNENYDENDILNIDKESNNFAINKNNLINDNLNIDIDEIKIIIPKKINDNNSKVKNINKKKHFERLSLNIHKLTDKIRRASLFISHKQKKNLSLLTPKEKEKPENLIEESQAPKILRKSIIFKTSTFNLEEQKDKKDEKNKSIVLETSSDSDSDIDNNNDFEEKCENQNQINDQNNENENEEKMEIFKDIFDEQFNSGKLLSIKEEIFFNLQYILSLVNCTQGKNDIFKIIKEAKLNFIFYDRIKNSNKQQNELFLLHSLSSSKLAEISTKKNKPNREHLNKGIFCITDYSIEEIGDKLLQVSESLLNKINRKELYRGIYSKKDKEQQSPNVLACINNFNKLTNFVIEDVLSYNYPKDRANIYSRWVEISYYCKSKRDYNDCLAIYSALNSYIFNELKLTFKEIKTKTKNIFIEVRKFCKCLENYKNIREEMNMCEKEGLIFIPYLGMLLRDINFYEETSNYITDNGCLNIEKIENVNKILEKYFRFKNIKKKQNQIESKEELNFLENLEYVPEEKLVEMAKNIEPKNLFNSSVQKRPTLIDRKYFEKYKKRGTVQLKSNSISPQRSQSMDSLNY